MHELSLCRALLAAAERELSAHPQGDVAQLTISVGALSGCEPDLLRHVFPHAASGTRFASAALDITFQPVQVQCNDCGEQSEVAPNRFICAHCDSLAVRLIAGEGVFLTGLRLAAPTHASE